jgi:aconitase A
MKFNKYLYKVAMKHLKIYFKRKREKKRINAYVRNTVYRNNLLRMFRGWRKVAHEDGKIRIESEEKKYRLNLEREKLTMWTSKVDQLMLYIAQLEDKIK